MIGSSTTGDAPTGAVGGLKLIVALMAAVLIVSALVAFGPLAGGEPASITVDDRRVDYAFRHLGEPVPMERSWRLEDYGLRHMPVADWSRSPDYALRHLGE